VSRRLYFRVGPSVWTDHAWGDDERLAALYLLTSPHRRTEGIFRMPLEYAATDIGWTAKRFRKAFDQLLADGFVEYDEKASVCLIVNALKWQKPENPNQVKAAVKAFASLPVSPLRERFVTLARTLCPTLAEALTEGLAEGLPEGIPHSPTPTPTPVRTPHPPQAGETAPSRPVGKRQRDVERYETALAEFAARHFPGVPAGLVAHMASALRLKRIEPTAEVLRPLIEQHTGGVAA
jgi:hypothetical protein